MNRKDLKIAISGKSGCGNTSVSKLLAERLDIRFINFTFRTLAVEQGISLEEVLQHAAEDDWWDREVDTRQVALAREDGGCVLGSRLAIWMLPEADLKVYLKASAHVRAERIQNREGGSLEDIAAFTAERDRQDTERYKKLYSIDNNDYTSADLVIDTDKLGIEAIVSLILKRIDSLTGV